LVVTTSPTTSPTASYHRSTASSAQFGWCVGLAWPWGPLISLVGFWKWFSRNLFNACKIHILSYTCPKFMKQILLYLSWVDL
jgi:hypothetical protein